MAFVLEELQPAELTLQASRSRHIPIPQPIARATALTLSAGLQIGMIWLLSHAGIISILKTDLRRHILTMDLIAPSDSEAGATSRQGPVPSVPPAATSEPRDPARPNVRTEWSVAKLPHTPQILATILAAKSPAG